ncbi:MAG: hypothetical protein VX986_02865 [Pseudomonadota bacterium]|nr:hypothetical protein [Pseudomonadota bacterium]
MKRVVYCFLAVTLNFGVCAEGRIIDEYKVKGRNKFVGKETFVIRTLCIDGYKFVSFGNSFAQFYEDQDGLPMPSKCDS